VKRRDVIRHLEQNGCEFLREGANHTIYVNRADVESSRAGCLPERKVKEEREHIRGDFHSEVEHRVVHCPDHHRNLFIGICPAKPKLVRHVPPILRPEVGTSHRDRFCKLVVELRVPPKAPTTHDG